MPVASCGVRYYTSVRDRCSDRKRHTAQTVWSHRVGSVAEPGDVLSFSGVSTFTPAPSTCNRGARPTSYTLGTPFPRENAIKLSDFACENRYDFSSWVSGWVV